MTEKTIASLVKENKTVFIIMAVVLFLVELEIFAVAAMKSGRKEWLQILDTNGNVVYVADGKNLSDFNKYYFEKTFGRSLDEFSKRLQVQDVPFPFRAWLTAAVGIPIGVILLFAFTVKAYASLFYGDTYLNKSGTREGSKIQPRTEFERIIAAISSFNIFTIGFLILLAVLMFWIIPNFVTYSLTAILDTLIRFKWVLLGAAVVFVGLIVWVVYLKYLLAKRGIDNQAEVEKMRLQLEYTRETGAPVQLTYNKEESEPALLVWEETGSSSAPSVRNEPENGTA
jgi:hypothetical protein